MKKMNQEKNLTLIKNKEIQLQQKEKIKQLKI